MSASTNVRSYLAINGMVSLQAEVPIIGGRATVVLLLSFTLQFLPSYGLLSWSLLLYCYVEGNSRSKT